MLTAPQAPYSLVPTPLPFAALATHAARLPLGGGREVVLAAFMAARLTHLLAGGLPLSPEERRMHAAASRSWFATIPLSAPIRAAFGVVLDALVDDSVGRAVAAWERLSPNLAKFLDGASIEEIQRLRQRLGARALVVTGDTSGAS